MVALLAGVGVGTDQTNKSKGSGVFLRAKDGRWDGQGMAVFFQFGMAGMELGGQTPTTEIACG